MLDYLIVGQGLAGSLISYYLLKLGATFAFVDQNHYKASSTVAAGIINPITGRRFVKSWRMDELLPFAKNSYKDIEMILQTQIFQEKRVSMLFRLPETENNWMARSSEPNILPYVAPDFDQTAYEAIFGSLAGGVEYQQSGRLKMLHFIKSWKNYLLQQQIIYKEEAFSFQALDIKKNHVEYKNLRAKNLIFCEGAQAIHNPYFNYLPFNLAKGEALLIRIPSYPFTEKMVKDGVFIVPLDNGLYWVGSSYNRNYEHDAPTANERQHILDQIRRILNLKFEVESHVAAIRPTVKDRKPFLGQHPKYSSLYIFNGLGAKGSYLGPYFAQQLVNHIAHDIPIEQEVNIQRFL